MTSTAPTCTIQRLPMMVHAGAGVTRSRWKMPLSRSRATDVE